ncbi:MAG: hypothetical protein JKY48_01390 [Flavobacteriales bacterium]|nr:hypothetical protein [Flavobacteriales bacterium]
MPFATKIDLINKSLEDNQKKITAVSKKLQLLCVGLDEFPVNKKGEDKIKRLKASFKQIKDVFLENNDDIEEGLLNEGSVVRYITQLNSIKYEMIHILEKLNNKHTDELKKLFVEKDKVESEMKSLQEDIISV